MLVRALLRLSVGLCLAIGLVVSLPADPAYSLATFNSRYTDEQPTLSGDGRFLAFVSDRDGERQIVMYDLQDQRFVDLPGLNQAGEVAESPSLSLTGRYLVYLASDGGRPTLRLYDRLTQRTQIPLENYRGWIRHPSISPDGRYVVFETSRRGQWDIEVLDRGSRVELDIPNGNSSA